MTTSSTTGPVSGETNTSLERMTLHWTAGNSLDVFPHYHYCIQGDGTVVPTLPVGEKGSHVWKRNTGNIGIAMCGGPLVTPIQIEHAAKLVAELSIRHGIPLDGHVNLQKLQRVGTPDGPDDDLVPVAGFVSFPTVTDHCFYAHSDGYYPERWDIGDYLPGLVSKAKWYALHLANRAIVFEFIK